VDQQTATSWQNFPTKYKFIGVQINPSFDLAVYSRQTYDILKLIGDVGGLASGMISLFFFFATTYSKLNATAFVLHKLFLTSSDEFRK
jgi:hypothetical protein